jgi:predicted Zn-dependent protease
VWNRGFVAALVVAAFVIACHKVPFTGRLQYNLIPDSVMRGLGKSSYNDTLSSSDLEKTGPDYDMLVKVGKKISKVADQPDYNWKFSMIDDDKTINAWCMPGGYIAFYTGILPVLRDEAGMAFVMGHETGHATAHHGAERLSQQLTFLGGLAGLELYLANNTRLDGKQQAILLGALGVGGELAILLPFSRTHESEADVIGMMYMAKAGYPPQESLDLWDRMESASPSTIPAFLSTHPSNESRRSNLKEWLPQAKKKYERNKLPYDSTKVVWEGVPNPGKKN